MATGHGTTISRGAPALTGRSINKRAPKSQDHLFWSVVKQIETTRLDHSFETTYMTAAIDAAAAAAAPSADSQLVDTFQVMTEAPGGDEAPASAGLLRTVFKFGAFCLCSACGGARIC